MHVDATTESPYALDGVDTIAIGLFEGEGVAHDFGEGTLTRLLDRGEARSKLGHLAMTHVDGRRAILVGLGERSAFGPEQARVAAAAVHARAREMGGGTLCWEVPHDVGEPVPRALVEGTLLDAYRFDRYRPPPSDRAVGRLLLSAHHDISQLVRDAAIVTTAQNRARDLGNTPGNELPPAALADYARELAGRHQGIEVEILDEDQIRELGMGAFAAVAQGSAQPARLIKMAYDGAGRAGNRPSIGLIGKGVTFDSGGLALKSNASMHEMKFDMAGGAAVIEAVGALAELSAPVRVLGIVGATENLPGSHAVKPGDIVRAMDGTTIEIDNPDAEGRLVLADCICFARRQGAERLVDLATLTGAIVTALGSHYAGLMSNDDGWAALVSQAAERAGEPVWRLPLHRSYAKMIEGRYAQLTNRAPRREAQAITAAELLHHFAGEVPWAHLDIAGTAWDVPRSYFHGKGATGFGVRLLVEVALAAD